MTLGGDTRRASQKMPKDFFATTFPVWRHIVFSQTISGSGLESILAIAGLSAIVPPLFRLLDNGGQETATCGLAVQCGMENQVARLEVGRREHTQAVLYHLAGESKLYEPATSLLVVGALRPGDIAIDIGAHVGYFSLLFRLMVGAGGSVYAFEPSTDTYRRLVHNVMINRFTNLLPLPLAVADRNGIANFHVNPDNEGESSLFAESGPTATPVQVVCLNEFFRDGMEVRPRLIKIDAEGAEMAILQGGDAWFDEYGPDMAIVEINRGTLLRSGVDEREIQAFFERRGYRSGAIRCAAGNMGMGNVLFRYFDADFPAVAADYPYVFNQIFIRRQSGLYPPG